MASRKGFEPLTYGLGNCFSRFSKPLIADTVPGAPPLRPGELRRNLVREIERFHDPGFRGQWWEASQSARHQLTEITAAILRRHEAEVLGMVERLAELRRLADELAADIGARNGLIETELLKAIRGLRFDFPKPREADEWEDPLFDSTRDYVSQIDRYKVHQGKETGRRARGKNS
jgi:hypothetical protein